MKEEHTERSRRWAAPGSAPRTKPLHQPPQKTRPLRTPLSDTPEEGFKGRAKTETGLGILSEAEGVGVAVSPQHRCALYRTPQGSALAFHQLYCVTAQLEAIEGGGLLGQNDK